jgi:hypothetical protein
MNMRMNLLMNFPLKLASWIFFLLPRFPALAQSTPARPFPQQSSYHPGTILPNHISRAEMEDSVRSFYQVWKKTYVRAACQPDEAYIWFQGTKGGKISVSEGQGYGMVIVALMAGYDPDARATYDALFRYFKSHPSQSSAHLMAWSQNKNCHSIDGSTATDGDLDIAFSLLLADAQWGGTGKIPYREEALRMIGAIRARELNPVIFSLMESDQAQPDSKDYFDTRSSDFMPDHLRAFRKATGSPQWDSALDNNYRLFRYMQTTYSPEAGLVPDFICKIRWRQGPGQELSISAVPARPRYLESRYDGVYNFNACRVPWRMAADYLTSGDERALAFLKTTNRWIRQTTRDNPDNISAGYNLSGEDLPRRYFEALCFIVPFAISAMTEKENQQWLNHLWDYIVRFRAADFDYYDNSIKMIGLIILSGNYWVP